MSTKGKNKKHAIHHFSEIFPRLFISIVQRATAPQKGCSFFCGGTTFALITKSDHTMQLYYSTLVLSICFSVVYAQTDSPDTENTAALFKSIDTEYTGKEAWRSWYIRGSGDLNWRLYMPNSNDKAWQHWLIEGENGEDIVIGTAYSNDEAWKEWDWQGKQKINIRAVYPSAEKPWKEWEIELVDNPSERLLMRVRYATRDDAWAEWEIEHDDPKKGTIRVQTRYIKGKDIWQTWDIIDNMPDVDSELKAAALFTALFSAIMPQVAPKSACNFQGFPLRGKVKFVESGEDFSIKYVQYDADIRVKMVDWGANKCGEWQEVQSGEDFKVKIVTWGEDLKVEKVQFSPGMR